MTNNRPTRHDPAGRAYLDLRRAARAAGRATDEYLRLYALECFLTRLAASSHARTFVLKGGVLLAAYATRRPTADIDVAARDTSGQIDRIRDLVSSIAAQPNDDDGISFDTASIVAEQIRDEDQYAGVRVHITARIASAVIRFHVDVNIGDPIWPEPNDIRLPRLLGGEIVIRGYPLPMVLAEKIVTAVQRGTANTRWRDFGDIYLLTGAHTIQGDVTGKAIRIVASYRGTELHPLRAIHGDRYAAINQDRWATWRSNQKLDTVLPKQFQEILESVWNFADPLLIPNFRDTTWHCDTRQWLS